MARKKPHWVGVVWSCKIVLSAGFSYSLALHFSRSRLYCMATLVFRLKYVPDEEADEIRQLLTDNDIVFYETNAGRWQISMAGFWVKDKEQAIKASALIREDQMVRAQGMRPITAGQWVLGYLQHTRQNPAEALFTLIAVLLILGISIIPFTLWL